MSWTSSTSSKRAASRKAWPNCDEPPRVQFASGAAPPGLASIGRHGWRRFGLSHPIDPMKPPPFLLGAALLFWGWQTGLLIEGTAMAAALESARWISSRWEITEDDFNRIRTFCSVLGLAALTYAFATNEGPADF